MAEPWSHLEVQIRELAESLREVRQRLSALEARVERTAARPEAEPATASPAASQLPSPGAGAGVAEPAVGRAPVLGVAETLGFAGRILLVLGGGFLLRAITEGETVPVALGLALGLLYAVSWIFVADRAASQGKRPSAVAHGVAAVLLGFPLVWETSVRFGFLSAWEAAGVLILLVALLLFVSWRHDLRALRWVTSLGAIGAAFITLAGVGRAAPFATFLLALGLVTLWDDRLRPAAALRWVTALAADLAIFLVSAESVAAPERTPIVVVLLLQLGLPVLYVGCVAALDLLKRRLIDTFALVQSSVALLVGLGGALVIVWERSSLAQVLGIVLMVLAAVAYTLAFRVIERAQRRSFHLFATVGMATLLAGSALLFSWRALLWAGLAVGSGLLATRYGRVSLAFQASLWAVAAAFASGLLTLSFHAFVDTAPGGWPAGTAAAAAVWAATVLCLALPRAHGLYEGSLPGRLSRLLLVLIVTLGASAFVLYGAFAVFPAVAGDAGLLAVLRTGVIAVAAAGLAWAGRHGRWREARWLVYPALVAGGLKMLLEDLARGRPGTLFLSFVLYGSALILVPRLLRQTGERSRD